MTSSKTLTDTAEDFGKDAKELVEDLGQSAGTKLNGAREDTASRLHNAASTIRATGRQGSDAIDNLANGAANRLDATASYVEDHDLRGVFSGLRKFGRRHLTGSLVAAAAVGFLVGTALNRATHSCAKAREEA